MSPQEAFLAATLAAKQEHDAIEELSAEIIRLQRARLRASDRYTAALEAKNAAREAMEAQQQPVYETDS